MREERSRGGRGIHQEEKNGSLYMSRLREEGKK